MDDKNNKGLCPICSEEKQRERLLVCRACYARFAAEAGDYLVDEEKVLTFTAWVIAELSKVLGSLQVKLAHKTAEFKNLQDQVRDDARTQIRDILKGERVPEDTYKKAFDRKKEALWEKYEGNKVFSQMKGTERHIEAVKKILETLQKETQKRPTLALVEKAAVNE